MTLVVPLKRVLIGLGNPGPTYAKTRHNVGFRVLDELAQRFSVEFRQKDAWQAQTVTLPDGTILLKPQTFMNLSGETVRAFLRHHPLETHKLIVVMDDADLPVGAWRHRLQGSSGGQKGLVSIQGVLPKEYALERVRIGIGRPEHSEIELSDWVLGRFTGPEEVAVSLVIQNVIEWILSSPLSHP